jgi:hypothetical protein
VYTLAMTDSVVYVGGDFRSVGGQPRASLAAVTRSSGVATTWNPGTDGIIQSMAVLDGTIYLGGLFHNIGSVQRSSIAAVDRDGILLPWAPDALGTDGDARVQALAVRDSTVFIGGLFSGVSGESREYFAALDAKTGAVRREWPLADGPVSALSAADAVVYLGGSFGRVGAIPTTCFAAIRGAQASHPPLSLRLELAQCTPNPVAGSAVIRYSLPNDSRVDLAVFDLQGRKVAQVIRKTWQAAGPHEVTVAAGDWRPGCYLYRLEAGGSNTARKMLVVR